MKTAKIRIHPAIGIARVGNSPEEFFLGPERPGKYPSVNEYRDSKMLLKRQGARFRLFRYQGRGDKNAEEINIDNPEVKSIEWTVHLVNSKASGRFFAGILDQGSRLRNEKKYPRSSLVLDGRPVSVEGVCQKNDIYCESFIGKKFPSPLKLGTLLTDSKARLIVLGGHGESGSLVHSSLTKPGDDFANHDNWYDDTSDGWVRATITWKTGKKTHVKSGGSWVIVAPPKYAPSLESVITLYDILYQKAIDDKLINRNPRLDALAPKERPSFQDDIYPILRRAYEMRWSFARAQVGHQDEIDLKQLAKSNFQKLHLRAKHIVDQFRVPSGNPKKPGSGTGRMPYVWSDLFDMGADSDSLHPVNATLTQYQYEVMQAWCKGNFTKTRAKKAIPTPMPLGLDRAALDVCVGAAFFPGIETSFHIRDKFKYIEPFRLDQRTLKPGEVTQQMSLPWQTDFVDCSDGDTPLVWWPAQRPVDVQTGPRRDPVRWARDFKKGKSDLDAAGMVEHWWRLGLLRRTKNGIFESHRVRQKRKLT
jgi:hypothetical protein